MTDLAEMVAAATPKPVQRGPYKKQAARWKATSSYNGIQAPTANDGSNYTKDVTACFIFENFMKHTTIFPITGLKHIRRRDGNLAYIKAPRQQKATFKK
jgi:hypothetical protein